MVVLEPRVDATRVEDMFTFQSSDVVLVHENFDAYCTILMSVFVDKNPRHFNFELTRLQLNWTALKPRLPASLTPSPPRTFVMGLRCSAFAG